jgi:hypothetical protein
MARKKRRTTLSKKNKRPVFTGPGHLMTKNEVVTISESLSPPPELMPELELAGRHTDLHFTFASQRSC